MQFDLLRAFPYPVLRPNIDDYVDGDIQATVTLEQRPDSLDVRAEVQFAVSVPEITQLVTEGSAFYSVVFACRDTYFRQAITSGELKFVHDFPSGMLRGEVLIYPYVVAAKPINSFVCPWINAEFGPGPFTFAEGSVLALDQPWAIYIDREAFKPISSIFVLLSNENLTGYEWRIDGNSEKVRIEVNPALKEKIDAARNSTKNKAILLNSIYFAAVVQCLSYLRQSDGDFEGYRWAQIVRQKCVDLGLNLETHDETALAQQLMKYPFGLVDTYCFSEGGEH